MWDCHSLVDMQYETDCTDSELPRKLYLGVSPEGVPGPAAYLVDEKDVQRNINPKYTMSKVLPLKGPSTSCRLYMNVVFTSSYRC